MSGLQVDLAAILRVPASLSWIPADDRVVLGRDRYVEGVFRLAVGDTKGGLQVVGAIEGLAVIDVGKGVAGDVRGPVTGIAIDDDSGATVAVEGMGEGDLAVMGFSGGNEKNQSDQDCHSGGASIDR
tara:strand:- start:882 stop:1262 length:381 start_codon:yes stop_codon:yes gene_type:complete